MTEETKKAPVMRFQGFSDDWEQRKLGELMTITSVKRIHQSDWTSSGVRFLRARDIVSAAKNEEPTDYLYISEEKYKEYSLISGKVTIGDLLVTGVGSIGVPFLITNDNPVYFKDGNVIWFKNNNVIDGNFFYYSFIHHKIQKFIKDVAGIGTVGTYTIDSGKKTPISLPIKKEQEKIGNLFKQLDDTLALHQRMSDKQKKLKANLLQMMFPRNGEKIPEVRLAGFAEDWAQRTLEDISDKVTEKNKAREFTETLTNSAEYGIISQSDFFDKDISNINSIDGYYVVRPDDFVYNPRISNFAPVGPIKRNNLNRIGIMSPLYYVFRPKGVDHTFLEKYFETSYWHIFMKMNGDSGARADRFAIKDAILKEMPIPYPVKEEQVRIGIFFNQLDKSIALHQEKIAHLKTLKNTLLNKMFI